MRSAVFGVGTIDLKDRGNQPRFGWGEACLLLPLILSSLRIGDVYYRIPSDILPFFGVLLWMISGMRISVAGLITTVIYIVGMPLHLILTHYFNFVPPIPIEEIQFNFARFYGLGLAYVILSFTCRPATFYSTLYILFRLELILAAILWCVSFLGGFAVGVDYGSAGIFPRAQGLLTEPSMLASIAPPFLLLSLNKKAIPDVILACAVCIISFSPTVYLATMIAVLGWLSLYGSSVSRLAVISVFLIAAGTVNYIDSIAVELSEMSQGNPLAYSISRLAEGVQFYLGSYGGYNTRGVIFAQSLEVMETYDLWAVGAGLGMHVPIGDLFAGGAPLDIGIISLALVCFGLSGVFAIVLGVVAALYFGKRNREGSTALIALSGACIINGGGVFIQFLFLSMILISLREAVKVRRVSEMRGRQIPAHKGVYVDLSYR